MKLGSADISKVYLGSTEVSKAYLGGTVVHEGKTVIEQLQELGCVMWFPLKESGQLTDVIGNKTIVPTGTSVRWDSTNKFYYVIQGTSGTVQANIALDWTSADFPLSEWTAIGQSMRVSNSSRRGNACCFVINGRYAILCFDKNGNYATSSWADSDWHTTVSACTSTGRKVYVDGVKIIEDSTVMQNPWGYNKMEIKTIGSYNNKYSVIRNEMLFNKALSEDEIVKVLTLI